MSCLRQVLQVLAVELSPASKLTAGNSITTRVAREGRHQGLEEICVPYVSAVVESPEGELKEWMSSCMIRVDACCGKLFHEPYMCHSHFCAQSSRCSWFSCCGPSTPSAPQRWRQLSLPSLRSRWQCCSKPLPATERVAVCVCVCLSSLMNCVTYYILCCSYVYYVCKL